MRSIARRSPLLRPCLALVILLSVFLLSVPFGYLDPPLTPPEIKIQTISPSPIQKRIKSKKEFADDVVLACEEVDCVKACEKIDRNCRSQCAKDRCKKKCKKEPTLSYVQLEMKKEKCLDRCKDEDEKCKMRCENETKKCKDRCKEWSTMYFCVRSLDRLGKDEEETWPPIDEKTFLDEEAI